MQPPECKIMRELLRALDLLCGSCVALMSLIKALCSLEISGGTKLWEYLKAEGEEKSVTGVKTGSLSILRQLRVRREKPSPQGPTGKEPRA